MRRRELGADGRGPVGVGERVYSWWYVAWVLILVGVCLGLGLALSIAAEGITAVAWAMMTVASLAFGVAVVVALVLPRTTVPPHPGSDGTLVVRAPALLAWAVVGAYLAVLLAALVWSYLAVTDFSRLDAAAPLLILVVGAVASLPELVRLLTGRLHRWEVRVGPEGLTYQGYRRVTRASWSAVRAVSVTRGKDAAIVVDLKGSRPDLSIPAFLFGLHPRVLADTIEARIR